ncbi:hypothetical protein KBP30_08795 [Streptomyces sp. Go40/10]|uniref:hypothetical protein n=1 Tax=Streptomyces sp. Go40/10 TaxID=2825844 RepID=UPI001E45A9E2|nr:hypothetical protein [Streptomyces sp. Go40/10]UFR01269.1 hypothetical protein KBP30_08795 [Streptomyces sp. Go40/10]
MAVDQLPDAVREFANYLDALLARLDPRGGWSGVFWQRDPQGMRACLDGREVPPWDVVEALLEDLGVAYGPAAAAAERERARALHVAALTAYDARPGARDALADRLDVMLREQRHAADRRADLTRLLSTPLSPERSASLHHDLAWAEDDHSRATARCAELQARLRRLDRRTAPAGDDTPVDPFARPAPRPEPPGTPGTPVAPPAPTPAGAPSGARSFRPAGAPAPRPDRPAGPVSRADQGVDAAGSVSRADYGVGAAGSVSRADYGVSAAGSVSRAGQGVSTAGPVSRADYGVGAAGSGSHAGQGVDAVVPGFRAGRGVDAVAPLPPAIADAFPFPPSAPADAAGSPPAAATPPAGISAPPDPARQAVGSPGKPRKRRRGSARFAGVVEGDEGAPVVVPQAGGAGGADAGAGRRTPRGARFAGVEGVGEPVRAESVAVDEGGAEAVARTVARLTRLRAEGRSGEAHVLLVEAVRWPVGRLPLLADALHRTGLGADWATLLWEAAALPAEQLVAAADALAAAGRDDDGRQLLRQGVARPAEQIGAAVLRLDGEGRGREVRALLDAYVRVRTAEEAARCAAVDPRRLVPLLLHAALGVSEERHWDLVHALRVAGHGM